MLDTATPTDEQIHEAAQILAQRTWNPLSAFKRSAAARTLRKAQIAKRGHGGLGRRHSPR